MSSTNKSKNINENQNSKKSLDSSSYESDVAYIGVSSHNGKRGLGTDKQSFFDQYVKKCLMKENLIRTESQLINDK